MLTAQLHDGCHVDLGQPLEQLQDGHRSTKALQVPLLLVYLDVSWYVTERALNLD